VPELTESVVEDAAPDPRNADSFRADLHPDPKADFILANPSVNNFLRRRYNG
jgi:hypothetical protein